MESISNVIHLNNRGYFQSVLPVLINNQLKEYPLIMKYNNSTGMAEVSDLSEYFRYKTSDGRLVNMLDKSTNSITKKHGRIIVMFLNYIFYKSPNKISSIDDITVELGNEFLNRYSNGLEGVSYTKAEDTTKGAEESLTCFYYWLYYGYKNKLKYIKKNIFDYYEYYYWDKSSKIMQTKRKGKKLKSLFTVEYNNGRSRDKVVVGSLYMVMTLINLSKKHDRMLTLGIALGAFAGLRKGEVCQMTRSRIDTFAPITNVQLGTKIDLNEDYMLRSDGKMSYIKVKRSQPVYEAFLPLLDKIYQEHIDMLHERGYAANLYDALFIDNRGNAMTDSTYLERFDNLVNKMVELFKDAALNKDIVEAKLDYDLLQQAKFTPHSLRYFFSQYVREKEKNPILVQRYRVDKNIGTQDIYTEDSRSTEEHIREIQNSFRLESMKFIDEL